MDKEIDPGLVMYTQTTRLHSNYKNCIFQKHVICIIDSQYTWHVKYFNLRYVYVSKLSTLFSSYMC